MWGSTHTKMPVFFCKHPKFTIEMQQEIPAFPSGLGGSGGKQKTEKLQKLVWSTFYPYCKFNSNCSRGGRALQKWCRAVALIPQVCGEVSWQQVAEGQQHVLNLRDRESYWV